MAPQATKNPCIKCEQNVGKEKSICCSVCTLWIHLSCSDVTDPEFKLLETMYKKRGFHVWTCNCCAKAHMVLQNKLDLLQAEVIQIKETVSSNKSAIDDNKEKIDKVSEEVDTIKQKLAQDKNAEEAGDIVFKEMAEREKKKENVIIFNLQEPDSTITKGFERKKKDQESLSNLLETIKVDLDLDTDIKYSVRLGELVQDQEKPRPLLVSFRRTESRDLVLNSAKELKDSNLKQISIVPDLTKRQQQDDKKLQEEAKKRNEAMNEEDFLEWEWRPVGQKGQRTLAKLKKNKTNNRRRRSSSNGTTSPPRKTTRMSTTQ